MYETLKDLHRKFYTRMVMPELKCDYDDAFQQLMSRLAKPERKLVLKAVDTKGLMMERAELDSFACRFQLALGLTTELQHYEEERSEKALCGDKAENRFHKKNTAADSSHRENAP